MSTSSSPLVRLFLESHKPADDSIIYNITHSISLRITQDTIHILRHQKDLVGGYKNGQICWSSVLYIAYTVGRWVVKQVQNYSDVIYDWSLSKWIPPISAIMETTTEKRNKRTKQVLSDPPPPFKYVRNIWMIPK